ncbi:MAG: hypothetical protein ABSF89_18385 [Acidimicrobiales bacterium]|jgi:hypothetical protein
MATARGARHPCGAVEELVDVRALGCPRQGCGAIEGACKVRGWQLLTIYDDVLSGKSMAKRDGVKKALDAATSGEAVIALGG